MFLRYCSWSFVVIFVIGHLILTSCLILIGCDNFTVIGRLTVYNAIFCVAQCVELNAAKRRREIESAAISIRG